MDTSPTQRFLLLDVMRAVAVFMMIQGHTIDALLSSDYYNSNSFIYQLWQFGRGLTAPIFLFGSGFAYVIASHRKAQNGRLPAKLLFKRLRWITVLFVVGALMHIPGSTIADLTRASDAQWTQFFSVDVLRLMAVTLLGLLTLLLFNRTPARLLKASAIATILVVAASPVVYTVTWSSFLPEYLSAFFTVNTGSLFPIFPFSAYLYAGSSAASFYLLWKERGVEHQMLRNFLTAGFGLLALPTIVGMVGQGSVFSTQSPLLFASRLGIVLLLWVGFGIVIRKAKSLPRVIPLVGQHTLLIYVAHVVILYGCAWFLGLRHVYGKDLELLPVIGIISVLLIGSAALAFGMNRLKTQRVVVYRLVPYAGLAILMGLMTMA